MAHDESKSEPKAVDLLRRGEAPSLIERLALEIEKMLPAPRGKCAGTLFRLLHARTPPAYFARISEEAIAEAVSLFDLIEKLHDGFRVRVTSDGGKGAGHERVALETVGRDQPFIYDSLLEVIRVRGLKPRESFHPIVAVRRDPAGRVLEIGPPVGGAELVSVIRIEIEGTPSQAERDGLLAEASAVLKEARLVAQDFEPMLARLSEIEERLLDNGRNAATGATEDWREAAAFLNWIRRANFVFLGFRGYDIHGTGAGATLEVRHGSGLGILREEARSSYDKPKLLSSLTPDLRERVLTPRLLLVHKTNAESRVLRRTRMDYIGVKRIDPAGIVVGEDRFLGLFTARAYNDLPSDIPILRKKLDDIVKMANLVPGSHDHKEVFSIFTSIPKSELFVTETARIAEMIFAIMSSSGRRDVRVSYRPDFLERGVSVMVLMPREKFNADVRGAIQGLLAAEFKGTPIDYRLALSDEPMARLHFYFATKPGERPSPPLDALEAKVSQLVRTWNDRLHEALEAEFGPDEAARILERYRKAFPASYVAVKSPDTAVADLRHIDRVLSEGRLEVAVAHTRAGEEKKVSVLKFYREAEPFALSTLMPILTHLGLHVLDEQTFRVTPLVPARTPDAERGKGKAVLEERSVYLHSFRLVGPDSAPLLAGKVSRHIEEILPSLIAGDAVDDALNALITRAGFDRRQTELLRAYDAYLHQLGSPWTQRTKYAALCDNPGVAAILVKLFEARFDPRIGAVERGARVDELRADMKVALERVTSILEDEILRSFESLVTASVRTNYFCRDTEGRPLGALAIKLRCMLVRAMPDPRPLYEIFVHSAAMEGVHLRSGKVARGGIRWSSRIDDYRMEILSLMRTQRTKNSVIVPVGAKGGFIVKRGGASPLPEEIRAQYEGFVKSLLDVTDNVVDGKVEHPRDVVVHDEPDPYLVVAADRGTATFSDVANAIAVSRSFWLGDAFASGGSRGYDHKKEGITARGAWELVRRHFRELGIDPEKTSFSVVGIGDMSGDVFGNGMIYSGQIRLIAAFNHAHIFLDPAPDPRVSLEERRRLFALPRSAWTDYDPSKISPGGGVFRRDAKSIKPSLEARRMLGVASESLNGDELVKAILVMRTDLLWNGGIGTYVKARTESHLDVSDPTNDAVRVDGADLRARVVAEGGNLGFTQLGRIEYARASGRINTDAIDNSAGVDLSDHEVNLKILLAKAKARGALEERERDEVLRSAAETVTRHVLRDNYLQGLVLSIEERKGVLALDDHRLLIGELSSSGLLHRTVEKMPEDVDLGRLRESGTGLTRPQLAVLLAYAKIDAYTKVLASSLPAETDMDPFLVGYFPREIAERFADDVHAHPLRREIAATTAVNAVINAMGISCFHRFSRRTGASFDDILRAWLVAADLAGESAFQASMDKLYAEGFSDLDALYQGHSAWIAALENVVVDMLRRGLGGRSARAAVHEHRKKLAILEEFAGAEKEKPLDGRKLPESIVRSIILAETLAERMNLADLLAEAPVPPLAAARLWKEAAGALLLERVEQAAARMVPITAEEIHTRASLLEKAREQHRRLAAILLRRLVASGGTEGNDPGASSCLLSPNHPERTRAARILDAAETSEPLTPSALFVVVEALGRMVDGVACA